MTLMNYKPPHYVDVSIVKAHKTDANLSTTRCRGCDCYLVLKPITTATKSGYCDDCYVHICVHCSDTIYQHLPAEEGVMPKCVFDSTTFVNPFMLDHPELFK